MGCSDRQSLGGQKGKGNWEEGIGNDMGQEECNWEGVMITDTELIYA